VANDKGAIMRSTLECREGAKGPRLGWDFNREAEVSKEVLRNQANCDEIQTKS